MRVGKRNGEKKKKKKRKKPGAQLCGIVSMKHVPRSAQKVLNVM